MSTSGRTEREGSAGPPEASIASSLEQVREILFGAQHRDVARRVARLDTHVAAQAEELRSETKRRLDALEHHVNKEFEALAASIESQRTAQIDALHSAAREAREAVDLLDHRVKRLEEATARTQRELRQQILDQAKSFIDEVRHVRDDLGTAVERELAGRAAPSGAESASEETGQHEAWEASSEAA